MSRARHLLLAGLLFLAAPVEAATFIFQAELSGAQETPPVATPGTGSTLVTYDDLAHTLRIEASFAGLLDSTIAAHIHVRPDALTDVGGVATQVPSFVNFPLGVTSGVFDDTFDLTSADSWNPAFITASGGTTAAAEAALFSALQNGLAYFNVHSNFAPLGEIRGDLRAVPEPATWTMMLVGFGALGCALRRRRKTDRLTPA